MSDRVRFACSFEYRRSDAVCRKGLHNQSHPRTDPVVIMAVVNEENDKVLLGRNVSARDFPVTRRYLYQPGPQRKWPGKFYSALAGFVEPGEAFEDAVKRELWEEAGLKVWGIQYHSTQPWASHPRLCPLFPYSLLSTAFPCKPDGWILCHCRSQFADTNRFRQRARRCD